MEPFPGVEPGSASIPRTRGRRSEGRELGKRDSDAHCAASKADGLPVTPFPRWRESNPLRRRLRGVPATLAVIPVELARLERAASSMPWKRSNLLS